MPPKCLPTKEHTTQPVKHRVFLFLQTEHKSQEATISNYQFTGNYDDQGTRKLLHGSNQQNPNSGKLLNKTTGLEKGEKGGEGRQGTWKEEERTREQEKTTGGETYRKQRFNRQAKQVPLLVMSE